MKRSLHFLARALHAGQIWSIRDAALNELHALLASPEAQAFDDDPGQPVALTQRLPLVRGNGKSVALIQFHGVVISRVPDWAERYGYVNPQRFAAELRQLADDPTVSSIVISVDSPGGTVAGTVDAGDAVAYARSRKRVVAVANDTAASAAYWVAAQASEIVLTPTAVVGSIGVIATHADYTKYLSEWGIVVSYVRSAAKKALGQPYEPFTEEARQEWQAMVDAMYAQFLQAVAKGRRRRREEVKSGWGSGEVWTGPAAVTAGLADRVGSLSTVLAELTGAAPPSAADPPPADDEDDDPSDDSDAPDAHTAPPPAVSGSPGAEQNASSTDDPPTTPEAGSSITPDPAPQAQEDPMDIDAILAKVANGEALTDAERSALKAHLAAQKLAAQQDKPAASSAPAASVDASTLSPEVKALLDQANARAEAAEKTANAERDARLNREFSERAQRLGQPAAFGATLRAAHEKLSAEEYTALEASLNATGAQMSLVGEAGSSQDRRASGSVHEEYKARVTAAMQADPKLTRAEAGQKVMRDDPEFAARYRG